MEYLVYRTFTDSLYALYRKGGPYQKAAQQAKALIGDIYLSNAQPEAYFDPFHALTLTNHGENRIKHCLKYDLTARCRLITIRNKDVCTLCFVGTHEEADRWLEQNRKLIIELKDKDDLQSITSTENLNYSAHEPQVDSPTEKLYQKLSTRTYQHLESLISNDLLKIYLRTVEKSVSELELTHATDAIEDKRLKNALLEIFISLKHDRISQAKALIDRLRQNYNPSQPAQPDDPEELISSPPIISDIGDVYEQITFYFENARWYEWMNYLHPDQRKFVEKDYTGSYRLSGVSGSGKTTIVVTRALRLAKTYPDALILIITLNQSLTRLLQDLLTYADPGQQYQSQITVKSMGQLCKEELAKIGDNPPADHNSEPSKVQIEELTAISGAFVESTWREFFFQKGNKSIAKTLSPIIEILKNWGISPSEYIRQEFDWIRSALPPQDRDEYIDLKREGRKIPLSKQLREVMLNGLGQWELHLAKIQESDSLRWVNEVLKHIGQLKPIYRCILVDEVQDMGTTELRILRMLTPEDKNDLFLTGDYAQKVYIKHQHFPSAKINIKGKAKVLRKNYRNTQEILTAAYHMLLYNFQQADVSQVQDILFEPKGTHLRGEKPYVLRAEKPGLSSEVDHALSHIQNQDYTSRLYKSCVAFAGLNTLEVDEWANQYQIPLLNEEASLIEQDVFFSDLEQTKGFEFDVMIIVNCKQNAIPNPQLPAEEQYLDACKLYVAMTRAKRELILSYHGQLTSLLQDQGKYLIYSTWQEAFSADS